jgi:hypothetical protein
MRKTKTVGVEAPPERIKVTFQGGKRSPVSGLRIGAGGRGLQPEWQEDRRRESWCPCP